MATIKRSLNLDADLYRSLAAVAAASGQNASEVLRDAIQSRVREMLPETLCVLERATSVQDD